MDILALAGIVIVCFLALIYGLYRLFTDAVPEEEKNKAELERLILGHELKRTPPPSKEETADTIPQPDFAMPPDLSTPAKDDDHVGYRLPRTPGEPPDFT